MGVEISAGSGECLTSSGIGEVSDSAGFASICAWEGEVTGLNEGGSVIMGDESRCVSLGEARSVKVDTVGK